MDAHDVHIGLRIKTRRKELKKTQGDIAKLLKISPQAFSQYECGKTYIKKSDLQQIALILSCNINYFYE